MEKHRYVTVVWYFSLVKGSMIRVL